MLHLQYSLNMPEFLSMNFMSSIFRLIFSLSSIFNSWYLWANHVRVEQCDCLYVTFTPDFLFFSISFWISYLSIICLSIHFSIQIWKEDMYLQVALIKLLVCSKDACILFTSSILSLSENVLHNVHVFYIY